MNEQCFSCEFLRLRDFLDGKPFCDYGNGEEDNCYYYEYDEAKEKVVQIIFWKIRKPKSDVIHDFKKSLEYVSKRPFYHYEPPPKPDNYVVENRLRSVIGLLESLQEKIYSLERKLIFQNEIRRPPVYSEPKNPQRRADMGIFIFAIAVLLILNALFFLMGVL